MKTALQIYTSKQPCRCLHPTATFYTYLTNFLNRAGGKLVTREIWL